VVAVVEVEGVIQEQAMTTMNREAWLTEMARQLETILFPKAKLEPYRITCGWPCRNAMGKRFRRVGECHGAKSSKDGHHEIFISPLLDDPLEVAGTVAHELVHVAVGLNAKHGRYFWEICCIAGLTKGPPTQAAPGPKLNERLGKIIAVQGAYPHQAIVPVAKVVHAASVVKVCCVDCGCVAVLSNKWLDKAGYPTCGCGGEMARPD
jgi:hypothetical protein